MSAGLEEALRAINSGIDHYQRYPCLVDCYEFPSKITRPEQAKKRGGTATRVNSLVWRDAQERMETEKRGVNWVTTFYTGRVEAGSDQRRRGACVLFCRRRA